MLVSGRVVGTYHVVSKKTKCIFDLVWGSIYFLASGQQVGKHKIESTRLKKHKMEHLGRVSHTNFQTEEILQPAMGNIHRPESA